MSSAHTTPSSYTWCQIKLLAAFISGALILFATFIAVSAHSSLVGSQPGDGEILDTAPERVTAKFSEELDSAGSKLWVLDQDGRQVDDGNGGLDLNDLEHLSMVASLPGPLPDGAYTAHWVAASAEDGDTTQGIFTFGVGQDTVLEEAATPQPGGLPIFGLIASGVVVLSLAVVLFRRRQPTSDK